MVKAIGLLPSLLQLCNYERRLKKDQTAINESVNEYILFRQNITDHIQLVTFDVSTATAEVDCEIKRCIQARDMLMVRENRNIKKITILSIIAGSASAIVAGALALNNYANSGSIIEITGGILGATLGMSTFIIQPRKMMFMHKRNLLKGIWDETDVNVYFAPAVHYYLHHSIYYQQTNVQQLRESWVFYKMDKDLYFGEGGIYSAQELETRAKMLGQIETKIKLMNNDLTILLNELVSNQPKY
jgi:hypothetical protein